MKKISIIIATYNAGKVLQRCLDSIRPQKMEEIELLVIDGNSKDDTMEIVNANKDIIDISISEPDKGIYDAWNKGIKAASGEWIEFLGSDDLLIEGSLGFYLNYLKRQENVETYDIIYGRCWFINEEGKRIRSFGDPYKWSQFRRFVRCSHGSALHSKKLFKEVGLFNLEFKICADYELLLRKRLKALYVDREIIEMQVGGCSDSIKGLVESYKVKQYRHSSSVFVNIYYLVKGIAGYYYRKLYVNRCLISNKNL